VNEKPVSASIAHKVIRNTILNFAGRVWVLLINLLLVPYIVSHLGVERFGIWTLIMVLIGYATALDLGAGAAFVKHIAEYDSRGEVPVINEIVTTGFIFYLVLATIITGAVFILGDVFLDWFHIPPTLREEARFLLLLGAAIFTFSNVFSTFQAVVMGLQRMDVKNVIVILVSVPEVVGTVVVLELGYGLRGLMINEAIIAILTAGAFTLAAFRVFPNLRLVPHLCRLTRLRQLLRFGVNVQISQLAELASSQADKLLLGLFLGASMVTYYELGTRVVLTAKRLSWVWISAVMPAASEIDARQDHHLLNLLYFRGSKYLSLATIPMFLFLIISAQWILQVWLGPGYELSAMVMQALAGAHCIHLLTGIGTMIVKGIGRPEYETRYTLLLVALQTVLGVLLVRTLGFMGVLIGTPLALILSSAYFFVVLHRLLGIPLTLFIRRVHLPTVAAALVAGLIIWGVGQGVGTFSWTPGRFVSLIALGGIGILYFVLYGLIALKMGYLDDYDRRMFSRIGQALARA